MVIISAAERAKELSRREGGDNWAIALLARWLEEDAETGAYVNVALDNVPHDAGHHLHNPLTCERCCHLQTYIYCLLLQTGSYRACS